MPLRRHTLRLPPIGEPGEDFELIEELLFLDDDLVRLDDPLLQGYDKDLDEFIAKILAE